MANSPNRLSVALIEDLAFIKVQGRANAGLSVQFKCVAVELGNSSRKNLVVDLTECEMMDSTFLGVLAGLVANVNPANAQAPRLDVRLLNTSPRLMELLENLGVKHLFTFLQGSLPVGAATPLSPLEHAPASKAEMSRTCLEAHQLLMALNPDNVHKFKDVTQFLAEDLKQATQGKAN